LACLFTLTLLGQARRTKVNVVGQRSPPHEENVGKIVGATSSEGFLDITAFIVYVFVVISPAFYM